MSKFMPDITHHGRPAVHLGLDRVGMSEIEVPIRVEIPGQGSAMLTSNIDAFVSLDDPKAKGIHMSRLFLIVQNKLGGQVVDGDTISSVLEEFLDSHKDLSKTAHLKLSFQLPVHRKALLSDHYGWRYYPIEISATKDAEQMRVRQWFRVTYSSTCPCSAALARQLIQNKFNQDFSAQDKVSTEEVFTWLGKETSIMATPHGQRSHADVTIVPNDPKELVDLVSLIDATEAAIKTPVQAAVKRQDEQEFSRLNGENLVFSEDAARKIAKVFDSNPQIYDFMVQSTHYESLHAHNAVAVATKGRQGGLAAF